MLKKLSLWLAALPLLSACDTLESITKDTPEEPVYKWAAYYDFQLEGDAFEDYDLVVLDSAWYPPVEPIKELGVTVYGYLSIGEVHEKTPLYPLALEQDIFLDKNERWESHVVDLRSSWWRSYILEFAIPAIISDGFEGIMLDTIESPLYFEMDEKEAFQMHQAAVSLIQTIRMRFPELKIMLNRGFKLLPEIAGDIDAILAESILTVPSAENPENYSKLKRSYYDSIVAMLHVVQKNNPNLPVYTLDYWQMDDKEGIKELYKTQRNQGFRPYISTPDLRSLHREHE